MRPAPVNGLLSPGVEEAAAIPLVQAVEGNLDRARAIWAFVHGMVILEINQRFPPDADLESTGREGVAAFGAAAR